MQGVAVLVRTNLETDQAVRIQLSVFVSGPGAEPQHIVDVGRCACLGLYPGLTTSPDGSLIAMNVPGIGATASESLDGWGLYIMGIDGSDLHRIGRSGLGDPVWQPIP